MREPPQFRHSLDFQFCRNLSARREQRKLDVYKAAYLYRTVVYRDREKMEK